MLGAPLFMAASKSNADAYLHLGNVTGTEALYDFSQASGPFSDLSGNGRDMTKALGGGVQVDVGRGPLAWNAVSGTQQQATYKTDVALFNALVLGSWTIDFLMKRTTTVTWGWMFQMSRLGLPGSWNNLLNDYCTFGNRRVGSRPSGTDVALNAPTDLNFHLATYTAQYNTPSAGNTRFSLYFDGAPVTQFNAASGTAVYYDQPNFYLQVAGSGQSEWQPGYYAGLRICNYAMSAAQIAATAGAVL